MRPGKTFDVYKTPACPTCGKPIIAVRHPTYTEAVQNTRVLRCENKHTWQTTVEETIDGQA